MNILIVEDDVQLSAALSHILGEAGYSVDVVHDGEDGYFYASTGSYDAVVLDVMLPSKDGFQVVSDLRRANISVPVLLLTARSEVSDKILGLDSGADDYMTKPFSPAELMAHLRALTRRSGDVVFEAVHAGDVSLHLDSRDLCFRDRSIHLSEKEFAMARILMTNSGQVIPKSTLIDKIWGDVGDAAENNVEAYISFLRKKLAFIDSGAHIETIRGVGYRFVDTVDFVAE